MATQDRTVLKDLSQFGCVLRIVLVGDDSVGCNTLISQFTKSSLTTRPAYRQCEVAIDGINVKIILFHWRNLAARQTTPKIAIESWGKMLHGALLVFDLSNHKSLGEIENFLSNLCHLTSCAKAIVGNKMDYLSRDTTLPILLEGKDIAKKHSLSFFLTNALTGENVEQVLISIAAEALVAVSKKTLPSLYLQQPSTKISTQIIELDIDDTHHDGDTITIHDNVRTEGVQSNCCRYF
ncbi:hypothetical protein LOD99_364 [Oopsacas minuta]|uniref:Uncharacterized protein n=1 Tax=Oopsacas minuta TaxID=111878 RepID=A0AAV7K8H4_9METZ|nr:hypothetical protein LOD99_364 [Oopsacas minuta]